MYVTAADDVQEEVDVLRRRSFDGSGEVGGVAGAEGATRSLIAGRTLPQSLRSSGRVVG